MLTGSQEVPPVTSSASGNATFTLDSTEAWLSYTVTHDVMNATAAHIHIGTAGVNGPIVIPLSSATSPISGSSAITPSQVADLKARRYYVNVHSTANPGGEIRGQILLPGETLFSATMTGAQEVPPVTTAAKGSLQVVLSADQHSLACEGEFNGMMATAAHIHRGAVGVNGPIVQPLTWTGPTLKCDSADVSSGDLADLNAGNWYVNVHSAAYPAGEIRGQLLKR
jgi:hypothetical protein